LPQIKTHMSAADVAVFDVAGSLPRGSHPNAVRV